MEELLGHAISVLKGMWRHRWPAVAAAWLVAVVGVVVVVTVPDKYEASARIYVDTQSILKPLMAGLAIQPNVEQQVTMLSRTLISRPNVEKLIRMADLDLGNTSRASKEALIESVSKELAIRNTGRDNLYTLAYRDVSPDRAQRVVQSMVSIFVESSLGQTRKDSDTAKKFIEEQIKTYVAKLEEAEVRLKEFRLKNMELQQGDGKDSATKMGEATVQLSQARLELREAENARDAARKQLEQYRSQGTSQQLPNLLKDRESSLKDREATIQVSTPEIDARLMAQKQNLDALLQRFTDQHPDVVTARKLIRDLEAQKQREVQELRKVAVAAAAAATAAAPAPAVVQTQDLAVQEMNRLLATSEVQVASLKARVSEFEGRAARARELLKTSPQIEAEFAQLNRDYGIHKKNYEDLVARRESASLSGDLEGASGIADFRLIDPPRASPKPVAPNRLLLLPAVLAVALGAGAALAFVLSQLRAVYFDARAVRNTIGLPVLGVVTLVLSDAAKTRERRDLKLFGLASSGLVVAFVMGIVVLSILASRAR